MAAETGRRWRRALWRGALGWTLRVIVPDLPRSKRERIVGLAASAFGAVLCFGFLITSIHPVWIVAGASLIAGLHALTATTGDRRAWRVARALAWAALLGINAGWLYLAIAFGTMLAWAVPTYQHVLCAGLLALCVYSVRPGRTRPGLPLSGGLGLLMLVSLVAWSHQDGLIECDDYLRAQRDRDVRVLIPTNRDLADCSEGRTLYVRRYPRALWESPDGGRFVFTTTQTSVDESTALVSGAHAVENELEHSICATTSDDATRPTCVGVGTAQAFMESPSLDRLFVPAWGRLSEGVRGILYELPRSGELRVLREREFPDATTEGFYDPTADMIYLITDEGRRMFPVRASTLEPLPPFDAPLQGGETRYDPHAGEGMHCHGGGPMRTIDGEAFVGVAIRGAPLEYRALGGSDSNPTAWGSLSWGCDFDPVSRRAWSTVPALGQLVELDYDSGEIGRRRWVGLGRRAVTLDRARGRLYVAGFLAGDVIAIDIDSWEEVARHFVGHFARRLVLSRDGRFLFATSNLGIVRIELP